jgi:hypothetical protein
MMSDAASTPVAIRAVIVRFMAVVLSTRPVDPGLYPYDVAVGQFR